jgi:hypothetical protein
MAAVKSEFVSMRTEMHIYAVLQHSAKQVTHRLANVVEVMAYASSYGDSLGRISAEIQLPMTAQQLS